MFGGSKMDSMQKGKKAEKIVSDMFKEAGFKVVKYGYEYTVSELADRNNLIKGRAAEYIRHQPDFIIVNKENEAFFIEVKFRSTKIVPEKDIFPYPNCYVVLLSKSFILAQSTKYLFQYGARFQPITKLPPFKDIPYTIIKKYVDRVRRDLGDDTLSSQLLGKLVENYTNLDVKRKTTPIIQVIKKHKRKKKRYSKRYRKGKGRRS